MKKDTENFLRILNEQNARIAAREAAETAIPESDIDPIRAQREQERRDKWGTLRARTKPGRRPHKARSVFPHVNP